MSTHPTAPRAARPTGGQSARRSAIAASLLFASAAPAQDLPLTWNLGPQVGPLFSRLESGQPGSLMIVGDSVSWNPDSYNWIIRDHFWADYGNAGDGYLAIGGGFDDADDRDFARDGIGLAVSKTGVVISKVNNDRGAAGIYSPDGIYTQIFDDGWVELTLFGPSCRLHYLLQPGGGTLRLTLDGADLLDLPTDAAQTAHGVADLELGGTPDTLKVLRLSTPNGLPIQVSGIEMRTGAPGLAYHRIARGAAGPLDFNRSDTTENAALMADVAPDLLMIMLDWASQDEMPTFVDDTNRLLDFYQLTMADARIVLVSHHPFKQSIHTEAVWLLEIAQQRNLGFINLFDTFPGGWDEMNDLGFMQDSVHFTPAGGRWFGDYVYGLLQAARTCPPDLNADGTLDLFDFLAFLNLFNAENPAADCTADGAFDLFDFLCFVNAFNAGC